VDRLILDQAELLRRVRLAYGGGQATFDAVLLPLIRRLASYVHLLPATPDTYFRTPGGLLRLSLETSFLAVQAVDTSLFQGVVSISERQQLEPRWRLATFIAGLCSGLHRTMSQLAVVGDDAAEWVPYLAPLLDWAQERKLERYHVRWLADQPEARLGTLFAVPLLVPRETLAYLAQGTRAVVPHMLASIAGTPVYRGAPNVLASLVHRASLVVVAEELRVHAVHSGQRHFSDLQERHVVDLMRGMVATGRWTVNVNDAVLLLAEDGLFMLWPRAGEELAHAIEAQQYAGVPREATGLLALLVAARLVIALNGDERPLQQLRLPGAGAPVQAVRLCTEALLDGVLPATVKRIPAALMPPALPAARASSPVAAAATASTAGAAVGAAAVAVAAPVVGAGAAQPQSMPQPLDPRRPEPPPESPAAREDPSGAPAIEQPGGSGRKPGVAAPAGAQSQLFDTEQPAALPATLCLRAPARLQPRVRTALAGLIDALHAQPDGPNSRVRADGLWISLDAIAGAGVETGLAVEALDAAGMLITKPGARTAQERFGDSNRAGIVVKANFLAGLPKVA